jgi:hypothetical protein
MSSINYLKQKNISQLKKELTDIEMIINII